MDISAATAADLALLTQTLDDPGIDLEAGLRILAADIERAIASFTGMTITIALDHHEIRFPFRHGTADPPTRASVLIPLSAIAPGAGGSLLLRATTPGAFVDLAADLAYALGIGVGILLVDAHLDAPTIDGGDAGLADHITINQAIGVLIGRGHTPESARKELHRHAESDHGELRAAAEAIIRTVGEGTPRERR